MKQIVIGLTIFLASFWLVQEAQAEGEIKTVISDTLPVKAHYTNSSKTVTTLKKHEAVVDGMQRRSASY